MFHTALRDIELELAKVSTIKLLPADYQGKNNNQKEFARYSVLPSSSNVYDNDRNKYLSGLVIIDIFVEAGKGQSRAFQIADALDDVLQNQILTNKTELGTSYVQSEGLDPINSSLSRYKYLIPFKLYGE